MTRDGTPGRRRVARTLHWIVAGMVAPQLALGWATNAAGHRDDWLLLLQWHVGLGVLVGLLMAVRIALRWWRGRTWPGAGDRRRARAATLVHLGLYAVLVVLPASGYVLWVWTGAPGPTVAGLPLPLLFVPPGEDESLRSLAGYAHAGAAWLLVGLALVHVAGALLAARQRRSRVFGR